MAEGVTHISLPTHKNTIEGDRRKQKDEQTNTNKAWGYQEQRKVLQHYMHVRTIASVGYKRKFHNATGIRHLETLLHWTLSYAASFLCSVSGVDCPSVVSSRNCLLSCPTTNCLLLLVLASLWVASSTLVRVPLPLPDTARFQVQESFVWFRAKTDSSALAACPHSATPLGNIFHKVKTQNRESSL